MPPLQLGRLNRRVYLADRRRIKNRRGHKSFRLKQSSRKFISLPPIRHMNLRQEFLRIFYPSLIRLSQLTGRRRRILRNANHKLPLVPIYDFEIELNSGERFSLSAARGKKILFVNTASNCGYTRQYEQLQSLFEANNDRLTVIGFPANDFKEQEKGSDSEIASFCKVNFGVNFPLAKKSSVIKGPSQNNIFKWLSHPDQNGWCNQEPTWNFSKYLVDEQGVLLDYFDPAVSPLDEEVLSAIRD